MKVSFLVTYYNQEKYVRQSLDSILAIDKPFDWEILVGDDGSSDNTVNIVNEYITTYPDNISLYIMPREKNKKYEIVKRSSANRLNLINYMTGDYFCILDGDDYYCDTKFLLEAIDIFSNLPNISIVAFGYQKFSEAKGVLSKHCLDKDVIDTSDYIKKGMYTPSGACVFKNLISVERKKLLQEIGYFDDNDIVFNNLYFGEMNAVNKIIYAYRQTDNSTFNSMNYVERTILNLQGYDVDVIYLSNYKEELFARNISVFVSGFLMKNSCKQYLNEEKFFNYLNSCKEIDNSITYKLLNYNCISVKEKKELRDIFINIILKNTVVFIKALVKHIIFILL